MLNALTSLNAGSVWLLFVLLGTMLGSFANVVIFRLPRMRGSSDEFRTRLDTAASGRFNLCFPNSFCPACETRLRWYDNIPVLSYLLLRGRCRACRTSIPVRYPLVEALGGIAGAMAAWRFGMSVQGLLCCGALVWWLAAAWIDAEHRRLPGTLTWPMLITGLLVSWFGGFVPWPEAVAGALAGYVFLWSAFWVHAALTGRAALGAGDWMFLAGGAAWLGFKAIPVVLTVAMLAAAPYGVALRCRTGRAPGGYLTLTFPFGPCLALGMAVALLGMPGLG